MKKFVSIVLSFCVCFSMFGISVYAEEPNLIDDFLIDHGMPLSVVNALSDGQKELMYSTLEEDAQFVSYTEEGYDLLDNENTAQPFHLIDESDLTVTVVGFRITVNGEPMCSIYPSFVWNKPVTPYNDQFSMNLYPGWVAVPGEHNLRFYIKNLNNEVGNYIDLDPIQSGYSGYTYAMPTSTAFAQTLYEGHAYLRAIDTTGYSVPAISLGYVHDTAPALHLSYSISWGPVGMSIIDERSTLDHFSENFYFLDE